jgi:glutamine synthetase
VCPWNKKMGLVFVDFAYTDGTPLELCSRSLLKRAVKQLKEEFDLELKLGVELEFIVYDKKVAADSTVTYTRADKHKFFNHSAFPPMEEDFLAISEQLEAAGIQLDKIHAESGEGQFELVIKYTEVMRQIENVLVAR